MKSLMIKMFFVLSLFIIPSCSFADEANTANQTEAKQSSTKEQKQETKEQKSATRFKKSENVFFE